MRAPLHTLPRFSRWRQPCLKQSSQWPTRGTWPVSTFATYLAWYVLRQLQMYEASWLTLEKILMYGLPGAAVLSTALQNGPSKSKADFPPEVRRSQVIRNLSVLVSRLETTTSPDNANHAFCMQASRAIACVLDSILDHTTQSLPSTNSETSHSLDTITPPMSTEAQPADLPNGEASHAEYNDLDDFNAFDFNTWALNVDFGAANSQWNIF